MRAGAKYCCCASLRWPLIFKVKHFLVLYLEYKLYGDSGCSVQICLDSHRPRRGVALVTFPVFYRNLKVIKHSLNNINNYSLFISKSNAATPIVWSRSPLMSFMMYNYAANGKHPILAVELSNSITLVVCTRQYFYLMLRSDFKKDFGT